MNILGNNSFFFNKKIIKFKAYKKYSSDFKNYFFGLTKIAFLNMFFFNTFALFVRNFFVKKQLILKKRKKITKKKVIVLNGKKNILRPFYFYVNNFDNLNFLSKVRNSFKKKRKLFLKEESKKPKFTRKEKKFIFKMQLLKKVMPIYRKRSNSVFLKYNKKIQKFKFKQFRFGIFHKNRLKFIRANKILQRKRNPYSAYFARFIVETRKKAYKYQSKFWKFIGRTRKSFWRKKPRGNFKKPNFKKVKMFRKFKKILNLYKLALVSKKRKVKRKKIYSLLRQKTLKINKVYKRLFFFRNKNTKKKNVKLSSHFLYFLGSGLKFYSKINFLSSFTFFYFKIPYFRYLLKSRNLKRRLISLTRIRPRKRKKRVKKHIWRIKKPNLFLYYFRRKKILIDYKRKKRHFVKFKKKKISIVFFKKILNFKFDKFQSGLFRKLNSLKFLYRNNKLLFFKNSLPFFTNSISLSSKGIRFKNFLLKNNLFTPIKRNKPLLEYFFTNLLDLNFFFKSFSKTSKNFRFSIFFKKFFKPILAARKSFQNDSPNILVNICAQLKKRRKISNTPVVSRSLPRRFFFSHFKKKKKSFKKFFLNYRYKKKSIFRRTRKRAWISKKFKKFLFLLKKIDRRAPLKERIKKNYRKKNFKNRFIRIIAIRTFLKNYQKKRFQKNLSKMFLNLQGTLFPSSRLKGVNSLKVIFKDEKPKKFPVFYSIKFKEKRYSFKFFDYYSRLVGLFIRKLFSSTIKHGKKEKAFFFLSYCAKKFRKKNLKTRLTFFSFMRNVFEKLDPAGGAKNAPYLKKGIPLREDFREVIKLDSRRLKFPVKWIVSSARSRTDEKSFSSKLFNELYSIYTSKSCDTLKKLKEFNKNVLYTRQTGRITFRRRHFVRHPDHHFYMSMK